MAFKSHRDTYLTASHHRLSGLQAQILKTLLLKRVSGARGCHASRAELLVEIWGWTTRRQLRWSEEAVMRAHASLGIKSGDPMSTSDTYGIFRHIPPKEYKSAQASLSRSLTKLYKRGLVDFVSGNGFYSGGPVLTTAGEHVARLCLSGETIGPALAVA